MKRWISMIMTVLMCILAVGCGGKENQAESGGDSRIPDKTVELTLYLLGDKAADFDQVYEEVNRILKEEINVTLQVKFLSWAEHSTKYSLLFSSGEDFDLIFTGSDWAHYETTAAKKGFYEMTEEFIQTYAPDIWEFMPQDAWNQAKVNGAVYMVPQYARQYDEGILGVRGDLMEQFGMEEITTTEELETYFAKCAETGISPLGTQGLGIQWPYLLYSRGYNLVKGAPSILFNYQFTDPENREIVYLLDDPYFLAYAKKMKEMYEKGYWSADSLSTSDTPSDCWLQGKSAVMSWNLGSVVNYAKEANKNHPDWNADFIVLEPDQPKPLTPYISGGMAINAGSRHKEEAMMVINQLMTNKDLQNITAYGLEGVHWEAVGDMEYRPIEENASRYPADGSCNWGWSNQNVKRTLVVDEDDRLTQKMNETIAKWDENTKESHIYSTFSFNEEKVKSEVAVVNTVVSQYFAPICLGMVDDVEASVEEFKAKLEEAGIRRIYEEVKSQTAAFIEANEK